MAGETSGPRNSKRRCCLSVLGVLGLLGLVGPPVRALSHQWVINEVFSNEDGTIQFVEMYNPTSKLETALSAHTLHSDANGRFFMFEEDLPINSSADKHILLATAAFAALPGAPQPDHVIADNSISTRADTIQWHFYSASILSYDPGELPLDGLRSWNNGVAGPDFAAPNSPTNFAGQSGSVNLGGPPAVPDGRGDATPMTAAKISADGSTLRLFWDTATCPGAQDHHVVFGETFPATPGGTYRPSGARCNLGPAAPWDWDDAPNPPGASRLTWWLVLTGNGGFEGSWGTDSRPEERRGPGLNGASAECGITDKPLSNTCGR